MPVVTGANDLTRIELNRLHPVIGTEVRGFSIADPGGVDRIGSRRQLDRLLQFRAILVFFVVHDA